MHKASRFIVNYCIKNNIDTLVVGKNKSWKQKCNLGKTNNQNFVQIPFNSFIEKLRYKCQEVGIKFIVLEESYTSRSSFIDNDELPVYGEGADYSFSGKRIYRGLYRTRGGHLINADINAAYNILRKYDNIFSYTKNIKLTPRKLDLIKAKTVEDKIYANYCRELKEKMHKAKRVV
jgi:putative transposase